MYDIEVVRVNVPVTKKNGAQHLAANMYGNLEKGPDPVKFEKMLQDGHDPNGKYHGWPLLHHAVHLNLLEFVKLLLKYGADPNALDDNSSTALMLSRVPIITAYLLANGGKETINAQDNHGETAYFHALKLRDAEIQQLLLDAVANPNIPNNWGVTSPTWLERAFMKLSI